MAVRLILFFLFSSFFFHFPFLQFQAGGFDAIFCIVLSDEARQGVETVWAGFKEMSVGPLLCKESTKGGLLVELGAGHGGDNSVSEQSATVQRLLQL